MPECCLVEKYNEDISAQDSDNNSMSGADVIGIGLYGMLISQFADDEDEEEAEEIPQADDEEAEEIIDTSERLKIENVSAWFLPQQDFKNNGKYKLKSFPDTLYTQIDFIIPGGSQSKPEIVFNSKKRAYGRWYMVDYVDFIPLFGSIKADEGTILM